jgi:hypothetical protein
MYDIVKENIAMACFDKGIKVLEHWNQTVMREWLALEYLCISFFHIFNEKTYKGLLRTKVPFL